VCSLLFSFLCSAGKALNFSWKLLVVYGPAYEDRKIEFIDELHPVVSGWQGPILIGGILICADVLLIRAMAGSPKDLLIVLMTRLIGVD
jgi:hypothetical protein